MQKYSTSSPAQLAFPHLNFEQGKVVTAAFDGGDLTSDAGLLLVSQADRTLGLSERLAGVLTDTRQQAKIKHDVVTNMRSRLGALACGYPDCNDLNTLRQDPALRLFAGRRLEDGPLAGQSTLSRWENRVTNAENKRLARTFLECAVEQLPAGTAQVVIDLDSTDDPCHGQQMFEGFNAYYGHHCYHPLLVHVSVIDAAGLPGRMWPVAAVLRSGNNHGTRFVRPVLCGVIRTLRHRFPGLNIIVRADSGFGSEKIMRFCECKSVDYVLGLPGNAALLRRSRHFQEKAWTKYHRWPQVFSPRERALLNKEGPLPDCVLHGGFLHDSDSWSQCRRVVTRVAITHTPIRGKPELNPRFVVTNIMNPRFNLQGRQWLAKEVYRFYCRRGEQENRIKEWKLDMQSGRTSCHDFKANQFRVLLHTAAMLLLNVIQEHIPATKQHRNIQIGTLRLQLLKVAARVIVSRRRIQIMLPTAFPQIQLWMALNQKLGPPVPN